MLNFKKSTLVLALATLVISLTQTTRAQSAEVDSYIVGTWDAPANGAITITGSDGFYEGLVTRNFFYGSCEQGLGDLMIKIVGTGYGSLDTNGLSLLGSFQAKTSSPDCNQSMSTAEFKLTKTTGVLTLNTCPTWGGECLNLTRSEGPTDTTLPSIEFQKDLTFTPKGAAIQQLFTVRDNSEKIRVKAQLYSDGKLVWEESNYWSTYSGDPVFITFRAPVGETGPFYICAVAIDSAGNKTGEFDNCYWRSIEGAMEKMANGCGRMLPGYKGQILTFFQNAFIDQIWFPIGTKNAKEGLSSIIYFKVNVRAACQNHDAGYQGATFEDAVRGGFVDARTKSRAWVDNKFREDIVILCKRQIKKAPEREYLNTCINGPAFKMTDVGKYLIRTKLIGAITYATAVAEVAGAGYDSDSTKVNVQDKIPSTTLPKGGVRDNKSNPKSHIGKMS